MALLALLALLGYASPPALGFALYMRLFKERKLIEALAFGWGVGWLLINIILMVANQILMIDLSRAWILPVSVTFLALAVIALLPEAEAISRAASRFRRAASEALGGIPTSLVLILGPIALFLLIVVKGVAYPETGPDSIFYHLYLPRVAFLTGSLPRTASLAMLDLPNAYPNLLVTQQTWIYFVADSSEQLLSRPLVPLYSVLTALLLVHICRPWGRETGAMALLLWASFQVPEFLAFGRLSVEIWSDMPVTFYSLLALHFGMKWLRSGEGRLLGYAGLFAAGAALTKYNGLLFAAVLFIIILGGMMSRRLPARRCPVDIWGFRNMVPTLLFLGLFTAATLSLFVRNYILFQNPVYPFLTPYLGGVHLEATTFLTKYEGPPIVVKVEQLGVLVSSLLFMIFALSFSLRGRRLRFLQSVGALYIALLLLLFTFESAFYRLVLPGLPAMAMSAAIWLRWALLEAAKVRWAGLALAASALAFAINPSIHLIVAGIAMVLLVLVRIPPRNLGRRLGPAGARMVSLISLATLSLSLVSPSVNAAAVAKYPTPVLGPFPVGLPPAGDEAVLEKAWDFNWRMWQWMNENVPPGAKVMTLEISRYYVEAEFVSPGSPQLIDHYSVDTLEEAIQILEAEGVGYVLDAPFFREYRGTSPFWELSPIFQNLHQEEFFELLHQENGLRLYRIRA
ncbi:MAG: glycosyltransferase family 39 protein [Thermoplasmata archaeon]